jgi:hypothetical protein
VAGLTGGDALRDRRRKLNRRLQARLEEELIST